jgi:hypothetical protein
MYALRSVYCIKSYAACIASLACSEDCGFIIFSTAYTTALELDDSCYNCCLKVVVQLSNACPQQDKLNCEMKSTLSSLLVDCLQGGTPDYNKYPSQVPMHAHCTLHTVH